MQHIPSFATRIHDHIRKTRMTRRGAGAKPESVPRGIHKEYPRMERIALPEPAKLSVSLDEALRARISCGACATERFLTAHELGTLLGNALGMNDEMRRRYPSGGALYPVETYLIGNVLDTHPRGVFHYHPKAHALEYLWETPASFAMSEIIRSPHVALTPLLIVFTSVWKRSSEKYGDLAYSHALIEAGHMAENVLLTATALSMGTRPIAGYEDGVISSLLDLDDREEQPIYSILLCAPPEKNHTEPSLD